jgi:predicted ester cyclase
MAQKDESKKVAREMLSAFNEEGETHLVDDLVSDDVVTRFPETIRVSRNGKRRQRVPSEVVLPRDAFPDQRFEEQIVIAQDDLVFIAWDLHATHKGEFHGKRATNKEITVHGSDVVRVRDGKIVEHWNFYSKPRVHALARLGLLDAKTGKDLKRKGLIRRGHARGVLID